MMYTIKKFDGDDSYSWAVFYASDVRGLRSPIFWGEANPLISGLDKTSARDFAKKWNIQEKAL